ncbi:unnamed protein product [Zymoseptoria tritici ST99CH_1E4]|uniref:N-acetylgalactosaminide beta-1,3-galactosyltransferase n=1 Tax=Zymoseptoria tritici ST99CH_1E4 TaxID=1276532 RepID=A0A2H1FXA7_ZYMTR|nr:unnamed protein product [Zymoseptoria tritici ST99CH_1E4]
MEESIGSHRVHDVYADVTEQERAAYPEFALYDAQRELQRRGDDTRPMSGGWDLAKYMNLAMLRKIRAMISDKKWFVFIDTDTFIDWNNLFTLLEHLNPEKRMYLGSPVWLPGLQFAHGGSAYALSSGALDALDFAAQSPQEPLYSQFGFNTTELCCGDEALARVLKRKGVSLKGYWPMFNGETPATLSFGKDLWCEPVVSLHHLGDNEMHHLWRWSEEWKGKTMNSRPLLFQDLFQFIAPNITSSMEDWHNIDERTAISPSRKFSHTSFGHCEEACEADQSCLQFVHDGETCTLSRHIRLGKARTPEGTRKFVSGWNTARIRKWALTHECESAHWLRSNP